MSSSTPGVVFLFGSNDNQPHERSCQVKFGSLLFFPLATQAYVNTPPPAGNGSLRDLHQCVADLATPASHLHLSLDGVPTNNRQLFGLRAPTPTFFVDGTPLGFPKVFPAALD